MKQKTLEILEFDKIKSLIEQEVMSDLAVEKVKQLTPSSDYDTVVHQMNEMDEIAKIYNQYRIPSMSGLSRVEPFIKRATIGGTLNVQELNAIKMLIQVQNQFKTFYNQIVEDEETINYESLDTQMQQLPVLTDLYQSIHQKCDSDDLYDSASVQLQSIRSRISKTNQNIKTQLDRIVKSTEIKKAF